MRVRSLVLVLVLAVAGCGPRSTPVATPSASVAAPNGVDLLFAQMMVVHHAQAVQLSHIVAAEPGVSERIRHVAGFIARDQQREIDETNAWLVAWGRPAVDPADPVVRQLHGGGDAAAHGMLSDAQLDQVRNAAPAEASRLFLQQMIAHHTGAITMARSALEDGGNAYIRTLATHVINEQTAENDAMRALLVTPAPG